MTSVSTLPVAAMQASQATLSAALNEAGIDGNAKSKGSSNDPGAQPEFGTHVILDGKDEAQAGSEDQTNEFEEGEIQEIDMESQAEGIRTVFSDPTNFNVKVRVLVISWMNEFLIKMQPC